MMTMSMILLITMLKHIQVASLSRQGFEAPRQIFGKQDSRD